MMKEYSVPLMLFLVLALSAGPAWADRIVLKNGQSLEGLIQSEDAAEVVLDFGYGTTVLGKADVKSIRRSSARQRRALQRRFLRQAARSGAIAPPKDAEELAGLLERARNSREAAQDSRRERERLLGRQEGLAVQVRELKGRQPALAAALAQSDSNRREYNDLVGKLNALNAQLQADAIESEGADRKLAVGEAAMDKYVADYAALRRYADAHLKRLRAGRRDEAAAAFFADFAREFADMAKDFKRETVASRRAGEHLIVEALLNDKVRARLLVDTGASQTVISPRVAAELGLEGGGEVTATLADGKQAAGRFYIMDSVSVGASRVEKTPVVVLDAPGPEADGLLGMSFLRNFVVQLDLPSGKLILEGLAAPSAATGKP